MSKTRSDSRRRFLAGTGAAALAGLTAPTGGPSASPANPANFDRNRALARQDAGRAKGATGPGSDGSVLPPFEVRVLNRMGFGPARRQLLTAPPLGQDEIFNSGFESPDGLGIDDIAYFIGLAGDDDRRLQAYVDQQLDPDSISDPELTQRMAQFPGSFSTLDEPLATTFNSRECNGFSEYSRPLFEVESAAFTRACYSRRQLFELMVDFWHNHLNVFGAADEDTYVSWASWDRDVIRNNTFGNFYQMVIASSQHPAMLEYLDNYANSAAGINENYARELFELHTMGAENYRQTTSALLVEALAENPYSGLGDAELDDPFIAQGLAISDPARDIARYFVDDDVYAAADALTGWRYSDENIGNDCGTGAFFTDEGEHNNSLKSILSRGLVTLRANDLAAEQEGRIVIKMAAYHPGTATYIARKLCRRLIADEPPETVVQAAAQTFYDNRLAPDQIARTLRTILLSDEFKDPQYWSQKTKRPFEYIVSAMRAAGCQHTFREDDSTTDSFINTFDDAGQRLFTWRTPDGFPDRRDHWQGSTTLVQAWRTVDWMMDRDSSDPQNRVMRVLDITLENFSEDPTPRELVAFWADWVMGFTPPGGWVSPTPVLLDNEPTVLGRSALKFFTQQILTVPEIVGNPVPSEFPVTLEDLQTDSFPQYWHRRLRAMVALLLWSPQFMER